MPGTELQPAEPTAQPRFTTPEGLRALLNRLHHTGPGSWRDDTEAAQLLKFATSRYAALARKHRLEPDDAARAAFETMLNDATRTAHDPWAVVTVGVRASLIAEERANGLLISPERARRVQYSAYHDAERFGDRERELAESHQDEDETSRPGAALTAMRATVDILVLLGWPSDVAATGVEYVCSRLVDAGSRSAAYENLRRDKAARAQLDLPHRSWITLLRTVLGHARSPSPRERLGTLARLVVGETIDDLLSDDHLVQTVVAANPTRGART